VISRQARTGKFIHTFIQ